jgi:uridine kinase
MGGKSLSPIPRRIIGISGGTCSGKSHLARYLKERMKEKNPEIISCDSYYRDLSHLPPPEREVCNFDNPEAIEMELLRQHLETLSSGVEIFRPVYDFSTHTRSSGSVRVSPSEIIIVEGLFVLYWTEIRELLDTKVFVLLSERDSLSRRLERDVRERGRTRESVLSQYTRTVKPMTDKYVSPSVSFANIVVKGSDPIEESGAHVISHIHSVEGRIE